MNYIKPSLKNPVHASGNQCLKSNDHSAKTWFYLAQGELEPKTSRTQGEQCTTTLQSRFLGKVKNQNTIFGFLLIYLTVLYNYSWFNLYSAEEKLRKVKLLIYIIQIIKQLYFIRF